MRERNRWSALVVLCTAALMIILDQTIVTVALPTIQSDLGFSTAGLSWVVNAYLVTFGGLLLLAGRLGDLLGPKRVLRAGLLVFTVASLLCALAPTPATLVGARLLQGAGGALASAVVLSMVVTLFPEPREQATALGVYSFVSAAGASIGLVAGGVLTQLAGWEWVFLVNVPIGLATAVAAQRLLTELPGPGWRAGADLPGAVLVTAGLGLGILSVVTGGESGWTSLRTLGAGVLAVGLLTSFAVRQARTATPLLPLRLLRDRALAGGNAVLAVMVAGLFGFQFLTALYVQRVLGLDALHTGLAFLPTPVMIAGISLGLAPRLIARRGPIPVLRTGLAILVAGLLLLARVPSDGSYAVDVLPAMVILGAGFGAVLPALMGIAMTVADPADSGIASGIVNTAQQVGGALGLAVLATVAAGRTGSRTDPAALTDGYRVAYALSAAFVAVALLLAMAILRSGRPRSYAESRPLPASR